MPTAHETQLLKPQQLAALKALEKIHFGNTTTFLNWADADSLVDMGLADKLGEGSYAINAQGLAVLQSEGDAST